MNNTSNTHSNMTSNTNNNTTNNITKDSLFCQQERYLLMVNSKLISNTFIFLYVFYGVFGIFINTAVFYIIYKTNQIRKRSIRLLVYLSVVDVFSSIVCISRGVIALYVNTVSCTVLKWGYYLLLLSIYASGYLFSLVGLDRYLKIKYLEEYEMKFTNKKLIICLIWYILLVVAQATVGAVFNWDNYIGYAGKYTTPLNLIEVFVSIFLFVLSTVKLSKYKRSNPSISVTLKSHIKYTSIYMVLFFITQGYSVFYQIILNILTLNSTLLFIILQNFISLVPTITGWINAIIFLFINGSSRRYLKLLLLPSNRVDI